MTVFKKENSHENTHRKCRIFSQVYETVVRVKGTKMLRRCSASLERVGVEFVTQPQV